jgi:hypothetical protein
MAGFLVPFLAAVLSGQTCVDYGSNYGITCLASTPGDCFNSAHTSPVQCYTGSVCTLTGMTTCEASASSPTSPPTAAPATPAPTAASASTTSAPTAAVSPTAAPQASRVPTFCQNGVKDNDETDTDCGGNYCPSCGNGKNCAKNSDCSGGSCSGGVCPGGSSTATTTVTTPAPTAYSQTTVQSIPVTMPTLAPTHGGASCQYDFQCGSIPANAVALREAGNLVNSLPASGSCINGQCSCNGAYTCGSCALRVAELQTLSESPGARPSCSVMATVCIKKATSQTWSDDYCQASCGGRGVRSLSCDDNCEW